MIDLYQGDAIGQLETLLSQGRGWDYVLTSPPYYGLIDYGHRGEYGHEGSVGAYLGCLERVFALVGAGMSQGGVLWLNLGPTTSGYSVVRQGGSRKGEVAYRRKPEPGYRSGEEIPVPWLVLERLQGAGWVHRETLIWHQANRSQQPLGHPRRCHEYVFVLGCDSRQRPRLAYTPTETSVLVYPSVTSEHPCKMAPALARRLLGCGTRQRATVLDPFCGTGTSLLAAGDLGYDAIGIDLDTGLAATAVAGFQPSLFSLDRCR
jgi:site-specific DNA-methyltransferase (adenine-specific)